MSCSETSTAVEPEEPHRLASRITHAGDDRRRAVGVQARAPPALGSSGIAASRASSISQVGRAQHVAVDARGVVGLELEVDRGAGGRRCRRRRCRARRAARVAGGTARSSIARTSAASACSSCGGRRVGGEVALACGARRRPASRRGSASSPAAADDELGRAAADVDHQRRARVAASRARGRAEERQPRLLLAGQRCARRARSARAPRRRTPRRWRRRAPREVRTATRRVAAPAASIASRYSASVREHALHRRVGRAGRVASTPSPEPGDGRAALELGRSRRPRRRRRSAAAWSSCRCRRRRHAAAVGPGRWSSWVFAGDHAG